MLVRLIDDYMLVTTSLEKARHFLDVMSKGHPEYGCFTSPDKTMTNFAHDTKLKGVTTQNQNGGFASPHRMRRHLISACSISVVWVPHRYAEFVRFGGLFPVSRSMYVSFPITQ
jgi:hypothetical protein